MAVADDSAEAVGGSGLTDFRPRLDILPPAQRRLWNEFGDVPPEFVLYGGTALHFAHRQSIDFDFFGSAGFAPSRLAATLPFLAGATITQQALNTLSAIVERDGPVLVSFFGLPEMRRLAAPLLAPETNLHVASMLDLAGTKAAVVQQRAEAQDYLDMDALLRDGGIDVPTALAAARSIYGPSFNPQITLKALSFFGDGNLPQLPRAVEERLARAAREVDLDLLPRIGER